MSLTNLTNQVITEIRKKADDLNRLKFGEITLVIQDGRLIRWELLNKFKVEADRTSGA